MVVAGTLFRGLAVPEDANQLMLSPLAQRISVIFPLGDGRVRAYAGFRQSSRRPLSGASDQAAFVKASMRTGYPLQWFAGGAQALPKIAEDEARMPDFIRCRT